MASTFRQQFRAGLYAVLGTVKTANPTLLSLIHDYPPESFQTPCAYVEASVTERVEHDASTRTRELTGKVVIVHKLISNLQATKEQDVLIDLLMDAFTADPHAASGTTLIEPGDVDPNVEISGGEGVRYAGASIVIKGTEQVGRL